MSYIARKDLNMAKCLNCDNDSMYIVNNAGTMPQEFCDEHLPKFFTRTNLPEHVKYVTRGPVDPTPVEAPVKTTKKKAAAQPVEEPVAE